MSVSRLGAVGEGGYRVGRAVLGYVRWAQTAMYARVHSAHPDRAKEKRV